jgi:hypothetical protein
MKNTFAVFVVVLCFGAVLSLDTSGFRPSKKIQNRHMHHAVNHDLEEVAETTTAETKNQKEATKVKSSKSDIDMALEDLGSFEKDFAKVKKDLELIKAHSKQAVPKVKSLESDAPHKLDSFEEADEDVASFLQIKGVDEMNDGMEDDDTVAPMVANRMRSLIQHSMQHSKEEEGIVIGVSNDGSKRTFDVAKDGSTTVAPPPEYPDYMVKPNDAKYRVDPNDPSLSTVPVAKVDPSEVAKNSDMPGTGGKQWSQAEQTGPTENDVVCVCKRHGAPRGEDRVKCKKHIMPSPSPTPVPSPPKGIRQCANGTWPSNAFPDAETYDVICIYYPSQLETIPAPTPEPSPTPDYPPECYDSRNEFVAEGVLEKRQFDVVLLQQGFHTCGC